MGGQVAVGGRVGTEVVVVVAVEQPLVGARAALDHGDAGAVDVAHAVGFVAAVIAGGGVGGGGLHSAQVVGQLVGLDRVRMPQQPLSVRAMAPLTPGWPLL